jgi:hypothetical protein
MTTLVGLFFTIAVLAVAGAGLATIFALPALRARLFSAAVGFLLAALVIPPVCSLANAAFGASLDAAAEAATHVRGLSGWAGLFALGYVIAIIALVRRRGGTNDRDRHADEDRARSRQRRRMPPRGEEV